MNQLRPGKLKKQLQSPSTGKRLARWAIRLKSKVLPIPPRCISNYQAIYFQVYMGSGCHLGFCCVGEKPQGMEVEGVISPCVLHPDTGLPAPFYTQTRALALGCEGPAEHPCSRPATSSQKEGRIGIELREGGKRAGRDCHCKSPESQAGEVQLPFQSNFRSIKQWWLTSLPRGFHWHPGTAKFCRGGRDSPTLRSDSLTLRSVRGRNLALNLGCALTSSVTHLPSSMPFLPAIKITLGPRGILRIDLGRWC